MSTTVRALRTLELIQAVPGITADRLAQRLEVSERAARRCVALLREAGIPIDSTRGPYGGYRIGRGVRLPPLTFTADEALGLVMAVLDGHHAAAGDDPVATALGKLLAALPPSVAHQADTVRHAAAAAPDRGAARPDPATTAALVEACAVRHHVRLTYSSESGRTWTTQVAPWAVVVRHGRWYLLCGTERGTRAYRVDRVGDVVALGTAFEVPDGLDPVAELEAHLAVGWEYVTRVVVEAEESQVRRWVPASFGRLGAGPDGTTVLEATTSNPAWYAEQLAALPVPFRVLGGPELEAAVRATGERLMAAVRVAP